MAKDEKKAGGRAAKAPRPERGKVSYRRPPELTDAPGTVDTPIRPVNLSLHGNAESHWQDEMPEDKERAAKKKEDRKADGEDDEEAELDQGLKDTFPASDPLASESRLTPGSPRKR